MRELNVSLPFYGKAGTISKIFTSLEERCYFKVLYDADGKECEKLPVSKKRYLDLENDYYRDVLGYLRANESKLNTYQSTRLKKEINLKNLYIDVIVSAIIALVGFVLSLLSMKMAPTSWTTVISILIFSGSGTYCGAKIMEKFTYDKDKKKSKFIQQYRYHQMKLNEHHLKREIQHTPTKYQGLRKEKHMGNNIKKTRVLEKQGSLSNSGCNPK